MKDFKSNLNIALLFNLFETLTIMFLFRYNIILFITNLYKISLKYIYHIYREVYGYV